MNPKAGMLLKTHIEEMSVFRLSIMLMKKNELNHSLHYVDERKWSYLVERSGKWSVTSDEDDRRFRNVQSKIANSKSKIRPAHA